MLSREQLIQIRDNTTSCTLPRSLRKTLFKFNIWCPSSKRTVGIKKTSIEKYTGSKGGLLNSRSINNKEDSIYELICDNKLDFLALTETWCNDYSTVSLGQITPPGYNILHTNRPHRGGGVALVYRETYKARLEKGHVYSSFEHQTVSLYFSSETLRITTVYLPRGVFSSTFNTEFSELLSTLQSLSGKHIVLGDFNFHVNDSNDPSAVKFKLLLDQFNLSQHVTIPTHVSGNTLDLVITRNDLSVSHISSDNSITSDHCAVIFKLSCVSPGVSKQSVTYRQWKSVDVDSVQRDISSAFEDFNIQDLNSAVKFYNTTLNNIVDSHAPEKTRDFSVRADTPWYNASLGREKRHRRKLERTFQRTKLTVDKQRLDIQKNKYNHLLAEAKKDYIKSKVQNTNSSKELFKVCNRLLNKEKTTVLPSHQCTNELADKFVNYFTDKIAQIREHLIKSPAETPSHLKDVNPEFTGESLECFQCVSEDEVRKIIHSSPTKSCALDPIPTWLLKQCEDQLIPVLTLIINTSLSTAEFSDELKKAFVTPLIKKATLDCEILKNYRPVSNLSFLSKLIERIVCVQLVDHLKRNDLYEIFQSAYRQLHSTETALLRVQNDLLQAVDSHGGAILVLLDLSAAFDTIDHDKLLDLLNKSFGIRGDALQWFSSYLKDRTQTVQIGSSFSKEQTLSYGVPQGSVLGPILFTIYTTPLGRIIRNHGLTFHLYADDTQLYIAFKPSSAISKEEAVARIEACVEDIRIWMTNNLLKLNDDKTELIVITSRDDISKIANISINVGGHWITPKEDPPRNLGVLFDSTCSLDAHVSKICKSINYNLYSVGKIRRYIDKPTAEKIINASVTSRLDYCNSLLYGVKSNLINKLQLCQNNAARIITQCRKYDHITPVLKELHWLPVQQRICFKILLITYKALNGKAPEYVCDMLSHYTPTRPLRSEDKHLLVNPRYRLEKFGKRSFSRAAPTLWNPLPSDLKVADSVDAFKRGLKTHLFKTVYN